MHNKPDESTIFLVARFLHSTENHICIKVMHVEKQTNSHDCGVYAIAFATSLMYGQDPTQLSYNELRKHIAGCVDAKSLTPFPSTAVYRQPQVL